MMQNAILNGKRIYFASDFHLGIPDYRQSRLREDIIVSWIHTIKQDALELHLVGDVFDFWFEYRHVAPKGFIRLLASLAQLTDNGIQVHLHTGNHDMWMFGYLEQEIGIIVHHQPQVRIWDGKKVYISHGDGLGPGDYSYKIIKRIFRNSFFQWCYARLHPNLAFGIAQYLSRQSRKANFDANQSYLGDDKEWLVQYCQSVLATTHYDYMVFGHRHLPINIEIKGSTYINLGDWIRYQTYATFDGACMQLHTYRLG